MEDLIREVWGEWYGSHDHVFVYIHHIRERLGPCGRLVQTRRTMGYILRGDPPPDGRVVDGRPLDGTAPTWTRRLGFERGFLEPGEAATTFRRPPRPGSQLSLFAD